MFHFVVFHCVPSNFNFISEQCSRTTTILIINISWHARRFNMKMKLTISIHRSSQFINSIQFTPIHFNSMNPYSIQFNWIKPSLSWHYYYDFAGTSGAFSAVTAAASIVIMLFNLHDGVVLFLLHSYWHSWGEWWCNAMLVLEKGRAAVRWDLRGGGFEYCTCYLCVPPGTYYEEEKEDIVQCVM